MKKEEILAVFYDTLSKVARDCVSKYMRNHHNAEYTEIMSLTSFLDKFDVKHTKNSKISIFERVYCIEHDLRDRPTCQSCHENYVCRFNKQLNEYSRWCSPSCQAGDKTCVEKSKLTRLRLHGDKNYNGGEKTRETRLRKYGGWHSCEFASKVKRTRFEHYGDENYVNPEKAKLTKLDRYGDEIYNNHDKSKETKLSRYGDEHYNNRLKFKETISKFSEDKARGIVEKRAATCRDRYGVDFPTQSDSVREKTKATCIERYGVESTLCIEKAQDRAIVTAKLKSWDMIIADKDYAPCFTVDEYVENRDKHKLWIWKCNKCGHVFSATYDNGHHHRCYKCIPNNESGYSVMEHDLYEYVKSICGCAVFNKESENRHLIDGEIDIIVPDMKIAFEFDGLYWHSDAVGKTRAYHLDKTEKCAEAGYRLVHIFEDEWLNKNRIVKTRIKHILGHVKRRIFARKCEVRRISSERKDAFLEKYHIQGKDKSKLSYGLFNRNHLVAVMTFCRSRFDKKYEYELSRYATVASFSVIGGAGKLLKAFERDVKPSSLITYADRRWSAGELYFKIGFAHIRNSAPNYFYVKSQRRFSRLMFQKHKLKSRLAVFDENKSEYENMRANGWHRIFDCGNMVFVKTYG